MNFAHPSLLLAGVLALAAMLWTWRRHDAWQRRALERFISPHLRAQLLQSVSASRRTLRRTLLGSSVALLCIALAGPQAGYRWETMTRRGNDIIFAVDTSRSMLTPDVKPNRLARAKLAIDDFVSRLNGDAVGLVAFAGSAFLQCPITLDIGAFHESLAALDTHVIPRGGTDISSAIREAQAALQNRAGSDKILILVTDGEDLEGDALATAKAAAQHDGLKIYTVGVGSANGDLIPLPADQGGGFLKDSSGKLVKSRLDESALKALAQATGGIYAPLGAENQGLDTIYQAAVAPLAKHDLAARSQKIYTERFQWPLALSLALLIGSLVMGTRREPATGAGRTPAPGTRAPATAAGAPLGLSGASARWAAPTLLLVLGTLGGLLLAHPAEASPANAAKAYAQGDFAAAQKDYAAAVAHDPKQPILQFDAGAAAYKAGAYTDAARAFQASVDAAQSGNAKRLADQEDAYYNLGNTLYREGQKTQQSNVQQTIDTWTHAVKAYDAALQLRAGDADGKFNRDLVNRKLAALEKQQQQQQQQKQQNQSAQNQSKQDQSKQQGQSKQGQPDQDRSQQPQSAQSKPSPGQSQPKPGQQQAGQQQPDQQQPEQQQQAKGQGQPQSGGEQPQSAQASPKPGQGTPRPDRGPGNAAGGAQTAAQAGDDARQAGGMSRQEARALLDSVKDEEHRAPAAPVARNGDNVGGPDEPLKDW